MPRRACQRRPRQAADSLSGYDRRSADLQSRPRDRRRSDERHRRFFEGMVRTNEMTTLPEPGLAESWEIATAAKSITFHLRHGVKWSDGAPFTSHDVVFTMQVMYDKRVPNSMRPMLTIDGKPIEVEAPDDYTVRDAAAAAIRAAALLDRRSRSSQRTFWNRCSRPAISTRPGTSTRRRTRSDRHSAQFV